MPYFTKKPVTIEAVRYTGDNLRVVLEFTGKHRKFNEWFDSWDAYERHVEANDMVFKIFTLEGVMSARPGDWIIKGVQGEFYPCKPDIFEDTYEPAGVSEPAGVKPLPRSNGDGGWVLSMDFLKSLDREVQAQGWGGLTAEVTEIIALSVEQRILAALEPGQTRREVWEQCKEAAAIVARNACLVPPDGGSPTEEEVALCDEAERRIRARTPDDATAALKARDQRIRNEALREAARKADEKYAAGEMGNPGHHILALITEGQSDGE